MSSRLRTKMHSIHRKDAEDTEKIISKKYNRKGAKDAKKCNVKTTFPDKLFLMNSGKG
jgi:hypothetical protein